MNMEFNTSFLKHVSSIIAPSGYEKEVIDAWCKEMSQYVDEINLTNIGNAVAVKYGCGDTRKKIMITAHADEIGMIVTYIDNNGYLYFDEIGGIDTNILPGRTVLIKGVDNRIIKGVIGVKPIHLQKDSGSKQSLNPEDLWIDICVSNKESALELVEVGSIGTLESVAYQQGTKVIGKAMDNRCSLSAMVSIAKILAEKKCNDDIFYVATTQEELRGRGAQTAAFAINPDICIVLDVTHATDYPGMSPIRDGDINLGKGVVVAIGPNMDNEITKKVVSLAKNLNISYQVEVCARPTGTDANVVQISRDGIRTLLLSIPCRYMHSPVETIDIEDLKSCCTLITKLIENRHYL